MKETNRSGYEIRLDVLKLAEGIESTVWARQFDMAIHAAEKDNNPVDLPTDNRVDQTLATAERLYAFVADKGE